MKCVLVFLMCSIPTFFVLALVIVPRVCMERRARELLSLSPDAERTSIYLSLGSTFSWGKQREIDARIDEMREEGWTYLRAREANPLRTILPWGGGVNLDFIRTIP
ncbi:MAG: hypothetical protein ACYTGR_07160 [Planctomycetota bacterium]|jgi:hypothetical protein